MEGGRELWKVFVNIWALKSQCGREPLKVPVNMLKKNLVNRFLAALDYEIITLEFVLNTPLFKIVAL